MNRTRLVPLAAVVGVAAMATLSAAPATAATVVSRSGANAVTLKITDQSQGTGNVTATNDGSGETKTGDESPSIHVLEGQQLFNAGVLTQQATAQPGGSAACAGLAGEGAAIVQVGDSDCLSPGTPLKATLGSLDLSKLVVADPDSALGPVNDALNQVLGPLQSGLQPVTDAINAGLAQARGQFGDLGITGGFGLIEGRCTASNGEATGSATLADAKLQLNAPGQTVTLLDLPVDPAPNTHLTTNLSDVLDLVLDAVSHDLTTSLNGSAAPLAAIPDAIKQQIVTQIRSQVEKNLAPLEQNVLDVTLNKQDTSTPGAIKVQALDLKVLPALEAQLNASLAELLVGNAACGPADAVSAPAATPTPTPSAQAAAPAVPHAVSSGLASAPTADSHGDAVTLGLLALAALSAAGVGWLRLRRHFG